MRSLTVSTARALATSVAALVVSVGAARAAETGVQEEFTVRRGGVSLPFRVCSPAPGKLAERPLLVVLLSADRRSSIPDGRYGGAGRLAVDQGHRVVSFDLPAHGEREDGRGAGIRGFAAMVAAGEAPFDRVVADGRAVIDECIRRGLALEDRLVTAGVSRGGYCALRLAAADPRISAVAAFAPVTDWRVVTEFAAQRESRLLADLALARFAEQLAGRRVYVAIGSRDARVGTDACTRFILALNEAESRRGLEHSGVRYIIADDSPGHRLAAHWREDGIKFLLEKTTPAQPAAAP
jgi:dienelactone hydrolase